MSERVCRRQSALIVGATMTEVMAAYGDKAGDSADPPGRWFNVLLGVLDAIDAAAKDIEAENARKKHKEDRELKEAARRRVRDVREGRSPGPPAT